MTKTNFSVQMTRTAAALLLLAGTAVTAGAQTPVYPYPGDPTWTPMTSGWTFDPTGTAAITGANPYMGNGSLALGIPDNDPFAWAFYGHLSGSSYWGALSDVSGLSFAWQRDFIDTGNESVPWLAQTPVLRLLLGDASGLTIGELVWERYYTDASALEVSDYGVWHPEDLLGQNFWFNTGGNQYLVNNGCGFQNWDGTSLDTNWDGGLMTGTVSSWSSSSFCTNILQNAYVWGIAVGVGSSWPNEYQGYADYVRLAFDEGQGEHEAVYANFELPPTVVPEPGTIFLVGTGLLGLGAASWRSRRRRGQG